MSARASVTLSAGQTVSVVMDRTKPADNLYFTAFRFGVSRVVGQTEIDAAVAAASRATAVVFVGRSPNGTEGSDLENIGLPRNQNALISRFVPQIPIRLLCCNGWTCGNAVGCRRPQFYRHGIRAKNGKRNCRCPVWGCRSRGRLPQTFPARWEDNLSNSQYTEHIRVLQEQCDMAKVFLSVIVITKNTDYTLVPIWPWAQLY